MKGGLFLYPVDTQLSHGKPDGNHLRLATDPIVLYSRDIRSGDKP
ncbi:protein of unknown function [Vibrio tapetis subsp. tapetis]|uniref:Uncharacterized protein n=1 Tax=Vibrio tapetis subsp. tapetis TaxID=1671868 RepID=A0A2N8ZKI6_9VIBR|nr:protein of unknown function [Vibrio tapetis subsp. tapetis]